MSTIAVCMCKDEADIIGWTVKRMARQVDRVIVADNGSTDGTRDILEALDVDILEDPEVGYYQSRKMSHLAEVARQNGADWVVPFDADEVWIGKDRRRICEIFADLPPAAQTAEAQIFDHVATGGYAVSPYHRPATLPLRKVAVRATPGVEIHQGNHGASFPGTTYPLAVTGQLEVRHFPYRSPEQMIRKARNGAAAYAATDLPEDLGAHWRDYGKLTDEQITEVFFEFFHSTDPNADGLIRSPA